MEINDMWSYGEAQDVDFTFTEEQWDHRMELMEIQDNGFWDEDMDHDEPFNIPLSAFVWPEQYETDIMGWTEYQSNDSHRIISSLNEIKNEILCIYAMHDAKTNDLIRSDLTHLKLLQKNINNIMNNNNALKKIENRIRNNEFSSIDLKKINNWFRHSCAIIHNICTDYDLSYAQHMMSILCIRYLKKIRNNQDLQQHIMQEKYKPSRVQFIIDNFGFDALDQY